MGVFYCMQSMQALIPRELLFEGKNFNRIAEQYDQYPSMLAGDSHDFFRLKDRRSFRNDTTSNRRRAEKFASN